MFNLDLGGAGRYCDGMNRRSFLKLGVSGMAALGLPQFLSARQPLAPRPSPLAPTKNTSVILIWLDGGPGHMDMYDMKPDAPAEYRGLWRPIRSRVPGFDVTELYPKQARITNLFSMVRSLHHDTGDHFAGGHRMLTTKEMGVSGINTSQRFPSIGAIVHREVGARTRGMPGYVGVPHSASIGLSPGYFGGHMLGVHHNPFDTAGDPNNPNFSVQNLNLAQGLSVERLEDRRSLNHHFDQMLRSLDGNGTARAMDRYNREAFDFITGPTRARRSTSTAKNPDCAIAMADIAGAKAASSRRLVEAGSTFVTVHLGGWDHHWDLQASYERLLPIVDSLVYGLFTDLQERGLLDQVLVMLCGEFSRTPRMNDGGNGGAPRSMGTPGRDHWGNAMFCLMGGGGVRGGVVVGSTDRLGERPRDRAVTPSNIHATIYNVLGIDPRLQLTDPSGRPVNVLDDPTAIGELL